MSEKYTLTYADRGEGGGWTSFWTYYPELTMSLGNRFYSIKDGQLWEHNDNTNPQRTFVYGEQMKPKVVTVLNELNSEDKIYKNLVLEGNDSWDAYIRTNLGETTLRKEEFNQRESKWLAYLRQNELLTDLTDRVQGIGASVDVLNGNKIYFKSLPTLISVGEELHQLIDDAPVLIGEIEFIGNNWISVVSVQNPIIVGAFCFTIKNARVQGSEIRGYFAEITLTNDNVKPVELFAVGSNVSLSYVPTEVRD